MNKEVHVLSGGLDSSSWLAIRSKVAECHAISFQYGQRASHELNIAQRFANKYAKSHRVVDISFITNLYENNTLIDKSKPIPATYDDSLIVPYRNGIFLSIAVAFADHHNINLVNYGAHLDDSPYYPDCTTEAGISFSMAAQHGTTNKVTITSPALQGYDKARLIQEAYHIMGEDIFQGFSCYNNTIKHCGDCESCNNRKSAFSKAGITDMTEYENGSS